MRVTEREFLQILEKKATEQRKLIKSGILPSWLSFVGEWLGVHPWRVVVPMAALVYVGLRMMGGELIREFVLGVFGGFK